MNAAHRKTLLETMKLLVDNEPLGPPCEHHDVVNVEVFGKTITFAQRGANQLMDRRGHLGRGG